MSEIWSPNLRRSSLSSQRPSTYLAWMYSAIPLVSGSALITSSGTGTHSSLGIIVAGLVLSQIALAFSLPHFRARRMESGDQMSRSTDRGFDIWVPNPRWIPQQRMQMKRTMGTLWRPESNSQRDQICRNTYSALPTDCFSFPSCNLHTDCYQEDPRSGGASSYLGSS